MKLFILSYLILLASCSSNQIVKQEITQEPNVSIPPTAKVKIINILDGKHGRYRQSSKSFKELFTSAVIKRNPFTPYENSSLREIVADKLTGENYKNESDYALFLDYIEKNSIEPYSNDTEGRKTKVYTARAILNYKLINSKTKEVIGANSITHRISETSGDYLYVNGEQVYGVNLDKVSVRLRNHLANELINEFRPRKEIKFLKFKKGKNREYVESINKIKQGYVKDAIVELEKKLVTHRKFLDLEDANYNLSLMYYLKSDKEKALKHASLVEDGLLAQDFSYLTSLINEL